jgi:hypothetical protein
MLYGRYVHLTKKTSIFIRNKPIFSSERMYIRTVTARVQLKKRNTLVVSLKGLEAKTN